MKSRQLDFEAVLRPSRWVSDMQVIGAIPEFVSRQIGLGARSVWLHQEAVANICEQRHLTPSDAEFVLDHMPAAVLHPTFYGLDVKGGARRVHLVDFIKKARRYLLLVLRVVTERRGEGEPKEIWVSTGYPLSDETVHRYLRRGKLKPVVWGMEA